MLKGYRDGRFALGLMIGIGAALLFVGWLASTNCQIDSANQNCRPQTNATDDIGVVPKAGQEMSSGQVDAPDTETDPKYYERQDLKAQQGMADSTKWIVWLTGVSMALSLVGAGLLVWTLQETRKTSRAAVKANKIARKVGERQVRAYVFIERATLVGVSDGAPEVRFRVRNYGQSPARQCSLTYGYSGGIIMEIEVDTSDLGDISRLGDLGPGQVVGSWHKLEIGPINTANGLTAAGFAATLKIHSAVRYRDVFDNECESIITHESRKHQAIVDGDLSLASTGNRST